MNSLLFLSVITQLELRTVLKETSAIPFSRHLACFVCDLTPEVSPNSWSGPSRMKFTLFCFRSARIISGLDHKRCLLSIPNLATLFNFPFQSATKAKSETAHSEGEMWDFYKEKPSTRWKVRAMQPAYTIQK